MSIAIYRSLTESVNKGEIKLLTVSCLVSIDWLNALFDITRNKHRAVGHGYRTFSTVFTSNMKKSVPMADCSMLITRYVKQSVMINDFWILGVLLYQRLLLSHYSLF